MSSQLLKDIKSAAQKRIHDAVFNDAAGSKAEIDRLGAEIAKRHGGAVSMADVKSEESAARKVGSDYDGDWHSIKDLARMTIIVPTMEKCWAALADVKQVFRASNGRGFLQEKIIDPKADPCGYSSITAFVRTSNGRFGEIQINLPTIIFAKSKESTVQKIIGVDPFMKIKMKYQLPGGLGHLFYEIYRVRGTDWEMAGEVSKRYYQYFRNMVPNPHEKYALEADIDVLRKRHPAHFLTH